MRQRTCKSRGCKWPARPNDEICDECACNGTPAQQERERRKATAQGDDQ